MHPDSKSSALRAAFLLLLGHVCVLLKFLVNLRNLFVSGFRERLDFVGSLMSRFLNFGFGHWLPPRLNPPRSLLA